MSENMIKISRKTTMRGDDGYKIFSVRIRNDIIASLNDLAAKSNRSRNELINIILEYGVKNAKIDN